MASTTTTTTSSSSSTPLVKVQRRDDHYAIVTLQRPPVNSLNTALLTHLTEVIDELEKDPHIRGMILTSAFKTVFCAGLDLTELYKATPESFHRFWSALQSAFMRLYVTPLATIAAIRGHSPAGGCLLALCCDVRIMVDGPYRIGLNETQLGIVAPWWFMEAMKNVVGDRKAEQLLQLGLLLPAKEALALGMIDQFVTTDDHLLPTAVKEIEKWIAIPERARALTKRSLRQEVVDKLMKQREEDIRTRWTLTSSSSVQRGLGVVLAQLAARKSRL